MEKMRVTAVPEVRASAICSMFLYAGASRSFHDAGSLTPLSLMNLSLDMNTRGSSAMAIHCPSACRKRGGSAAKEGGLYGSNNPSLIPAAKVSTGPPKSTSTRGLFFSAMMRASASPDEKRTKLTLMPVAFSNSSNMGRAQFSAQIEETFSVSAAMAGAGTSCAHSASPNNGRAAMARAARCSKRRVMIIGNPPLDVRAASLFLGRIAVWWNAVVRRYRLVWAASNRVDPRPPNTKYASSLSAGVRLQRALAHVAFRHGRLRVGRCHAAPVEQNGNLVAGSKLAVGAAPLVDEAKNVPLVVCATADRRRCAQRIIFAKRSLGEAVLHGRHEVGVGLDPLVEVG